MGDLSQDKNIYTKLGLDETDFMPLSIRRILKASPDSMGMEDYFYMRMFPLADRVALYNNYLANQWATGFVPMVHYQNLNSKTLPTIADKLQSKIVGNLRIEGEEESELDALTERIVNFRNKIAELSSHVLMRGEAVALVDAIEDDEIETEELKTKATLTIYPLTRYQLKYDSLGRCYEGIFYKQLFDGATQFTNYLLCEHRFFKKRDGKKVPFTETIVLQNNWNDNYGFWKEDIKTIKLEEKDLPENIKLALGDVKINTAKELKALGVYRFKNTATNKLAPYSDIGESQFINATGWMMALETSMSYREIDKYIGRGRVLMPQMNASNGLTRGQSNPKDNLMDFSFMSPYKAQNGSLDKASPVEAVQFSIRADEWKISYEEAEAKVCARCGISVLDYDPTLSVSTGRTATEVNYLNDITANTVKEKRALMLEELTRMVNDIATMLDLNVNAFVIFDASTIIDAVQNQSLVATQYSQGLISLETAIKMLHPNWKKVEIEAEVNRINAERDGVATASAFNNVFGV